MEIQQVFDYSRLDAETRYKVMKRTLKARKAQRNVIKGIIESGKQYSEIRDILAYDKTGFQGWCEEEGVERKFAYRCIDVYNLFLKCVKLDTLKLAISTVYELAAPGTPEQAVIEIVERAEQGETITLNKAKWTIDSHKPERKPRSRPESTDPDPETVVYEDTPDPLPTEETIQPGQLPASVKGGHLSPTDPVGSVYRNGKAEASAPLIPMVNAPHLNPASNGKPYTNGNGTAPVDSTKLQAEVDRLKAENERLTRQLEAMRKLNTPPLLIHMVNDAKVSADAVSLVVKKHGEVKTRLLLQTCIEFKVTPHDILALSENWSQMVSKSSVDPAEEQRKADEKAAKKAEQERKAAEKEARRQPLPAAVMNPMKDAIYQGFGWERDKITKHMWGEIQEAAKQLCEVKCCPEHVKHGVRFLKNNFDGAGPLALAKHYPTWSKSIPKPIPETEPELELVGPPTEEARLAWENVDNLFGRM